MIWRERLPAGPGAACSPALGVTVSAHGLPGLILLSPCLSLVSARRTSNFPSVPVPTQGLLLCCPLTPPSTLSALPLHGPLVSSSIHSGGAGEGWPRMGCGAPALACPLCWMLSWRRPITGYHRPPTSRNQPLGHRADERHCTLYNLGQGRLDAWLVVGGTSFSCS